MIKFSCGHEFPFIVREEDQEILLEIGEGTVEVKVEQVRDLGTELEPEPDKAASSGQEDDGEPD